MLNIHTDKLSNRKVNEENPKPYTKRRPKDGVVDITTGIGEEKDAKLNVRRRQASNAKYNTDVIDEPSTLQEMVKSEELQKDKARKCSKC